MILDDLRDRRVAVWGLGQEGMATDALLASRGIVPTLIDDRPEAASARTGGDRAVLAPGVVDWSTLDVVVRAPGVSRYRPELAAAGAAGVAVTTAMALWLEDFREARVVAVTGTKGKSTTAALAASILRHQGDEVALIGNIGVPVTDTYDRPRAEAYVVEVSSFQAADVTVTPGVCVLTSLAPDHLDWHGGEEPYYRDKLHLIEVGPPGALAVSAASPEAVARTEDHPHRSLFGPTGLVRVGASGMVEVDGDRLVDPSRLRAPGAHNLWNLCGAIAGVTLLAGAPPSAVAVGAAVDAFDGLPSRCHTVGRRHGLTFVDDALASNPFATAASVGAFPGRPLTVIVGGADRGADVGPLVEALRHRRPLPTVVALPPDRDRLADAFARLPGRPDPMVAMLEADDMETAVRLAVDATADGGVVLFSPAAPTPEGGGGYGERSRQFIEASGVA